jgi:hypothetical protein
VPSFVVAEVGEVSVGDVSAGVVTVGTPVVGLVSVGEVGAGFVSSSLAARTTSQMPMIAPITTMIETMMPMVRLRACFAVRRTRCRSHFARANWRRRCLSLTTRTSALRRVGGEPVHQSRRLGQLCGEGPAIVTMLCLLFASGSDGLVGCF